MHARTRTHTHMQEAEEATLNLGLPVGGPPSGFPPCGGTPGGGPPGGGTPGRGPPGSLAFAECVHLTYSAVSNRVLLNFPSSHVDSCHCRGG